MQTTVDLLRHGELLGGVRYRGSREEDLTGKGRADMDAVWGQLKDEVQLIVASPLSRCREPASDWGRESGTPVVVDEGFREMHYGEWEGLSAAEIEARFPGMLASWRQNPVGMQVPGGEGFEDFAARVVAAWEAVLEKHQGRHVLLVAHSGSLRVIISHVLGAPMSATRRFAMPYAAWARVRHDGCGSLLTYLNRPA